MGSKSKILVLEGYCPGELKYFVYSEIHQFYHQNYPDQRFGENWLLVDYATKPIYQFDPLTQAGRIMNRRMYLIRSRLIYWCLIELRVF
ncbi:MAG: hypothetical protein HWD59_04530 [Coxiellaceae bacterium]|nr:MAG: hypothetical protein HWD59_04530 [Coxiellaceae bacterium]